MTFINLYQLPGQNIAQKPKKMELLETLRGIAALLIVAFHATGLFKLKFDQAFLLSLWGFGDSGVDFFFVLSGFLLTLTSFKNIGVKSETRHFLLKRFIRIYPFYWLINFFIIPIYFLMPSFGKGHERNIGSIVKSLLLLPQENSPVLVVAWFLSHIVFFYLMFAVLMVAKPKISFPVIFSWLALSVVFILVDFKSGFTYFEECHFLVKFLLSYHNLEFALGCLVGIWFQKAEVNTEVSLLMLLIGVLSFLSLGLAEVFIFQESLKDFQYYDCLAYGVPSIFIVGGAAYLEANRSIKVNSFFLTLGAASFSIYLTHYPFLSIFIKVVQASGIRNPAFLTLAMLFACGVTVLLGCLIHLYVEKRLVSILRNKWVPN
ncbi:MAG: acyltransferase [Synechococcales bacterium]|nr:acyltransferase [Synechococcales bacterium]